MLKNSSSIRGQGGLRAEPLVDGLATLTQLILGQGWCFCTPQINMVHVLRATDVYQTYMCCVYESDILPATAGFLNGFQT